MSREDNKRQDETRQGKMELEKTNNNTKWDEIREDKQDWTKSN